MQRTLAVQVCASWTYDQASTRSEPAVTVWEGLLKGVADLEGHAVGEALLPCQLVASGRLQSQRIGGRESSGCGATARWFTSSSAGRRTCTGLSVNPRAVQPYFRAMCLLLPPMPHPTSTI